MRRAVTVILPLVLLAGCTGPEFQVNTLFPEIAVFPEQVDFGEQVVLYSALHDLQIQNAGQGSLEISEIRIDDPHGVFQIGTTSASIPKEESWVLPIEFLPQTFDIYEATLTIVSNDEETPELVVPLLGEGVDAPMPDIELTPTSLDFGTVATGTVAFDWYDLKNVGSAPLTIGVVDQSGSGAFVLASDPTNSVIAPGDSRAVNILYQPTNDLGDNGTLVFPSDDPDDPEIEVVLLGNGGGEGFVWPEAIIDCPGTSAPPQWVFLDGSGSIDPAGGALTYLWSLVTVPSGSAGYLLQYVTETTELYTDIAGPYEVQLVVANEQGTLSPPEKCFIDAIPADDLHIELTWDVPDHDLDLHLVEEGSEYFDAQGDCHYCNKNPQWGAAGTDDDPRLDLDDKFSGPENINVLHPADGKYDVKVHYFEGAGAVTATAKVWAYGVEVFSASKVMQRNEVWDVGHVNWPDGTVAVSNAALYDSPQRSCE